MQLICLFLELLLYTAGVLIGCGLVVTVLQRLFVFFIGRSLGYRAILMTAVIGTPIHELGHAMMCYLFAHKVEEVALYNPDPNRAMLGYVRHSYHPRNPYQQLGNFFIALGPLFSGCAVITAVLFLCFPAPIHTFFNDTFEVIGSHGSLRDLAVCGVNFVATLFEGRGHWVFKLLGAIVIFSVMLHVNLSAADVKSGLAGAGLYAILVFLFSCVVYAVGANAVQLVRYGTQVFFSYCLVLFMVIFVFSAVILAFAAVLYLIRLWMIRKV